MYNMDYYQKYIKYKNKYLNMQKISGSKKYIKLYQKQSF